MKAIPYGFCKCGCGQKTSIPKNNDRTKGWTKGIPVDFVNHHNRKGKSQPIDSISRGERHGCWKGGRFKSRWGYILVWCPGHPRATTSNYVFEHIIIAEKALGKPLPQKAIVHHLNGIKDDNRKENLVICEDTLYHKLLHIRFDAFKNCGNIHFRKCSFCKLYDDPKHLVIPENNSPYHRECKRIYQSNRRNHRN